MGGGGGAGYWTDLKQPQFSKHRKPSMGEAGDLYRDPFSSAAC